ncbi:DUF4878 domain-containing protein [Lutibacter sp.]|jgi:hypothetical protein|uniref:DUF4878 domain-containing protein n=1 Tax=Lutibacter sp. TaxID=1925666 RepID=UPI001A2B366E|nr:DUF4878 domain-containing protein [Lutibacter sp.]MBI9041718.1 DUF4878 domain-containing protein [Lutibacter sp.]
MKNSTIYASILTIILVVGFNSCGGSTSSPGKAVISLYEKMKNKDFEKVAKMYVKKDGEQLSEDEAKKIEGLVGMGAQENEKKGGLDKITIEEEKISEDGNSAKVDFIIHYKNGDTDNEHVSLIKVNGNWLFQITNF